MTSRRSRRAAHGDALASAVGGVVCLAIAVGVLAGAPGAGVYVGLLAAWGLAAAVARGPYGTAGMSRAMQLLAAGGVPLAHPLRLAAGVGREDSPWPPTRLAAWWAVLVACLAGLAPWWAALAGARVPFRLTSPVGLAVSWCGWYLAVQGVLAARRLSLGLPPVQIEKQLVRERAVDLAAAGVLGAFVAVVVVVGLANAHQLALWAGLERHGAGSAGHDSFAGLGAGGAGAVGVAAGLLVAAAVGSRAYARAWLAPHRRRQHLAQSWYERWQAALGPRVPTPLFHEEQELPADAPSVFAATFEVPPGGKMDDYVACAERLAPALRTDTVLVSALPRTGAEGQVIFGTESAQYFQVQFPLVDVGPAPHLNRSLDRHALAFGVSYQFRQVFRELKLGQPTLYSLSVLSEDDSEGFMAEADWKLPPGVTFDSVAKAEGALRDKLEVPWLRVGRRSVRLPGQSVTPDLVSVVYGDGPERTTFKPSFGAHALQLIRSMEWDSRFRKCGLVRDGIGPTVVERTVLPDDMVDDVFEYAAGLDSRAILAAKEQLQVAGGFGYLEFRSDANPRRFHLITSDIDPLKRPRLFRDWAPQILRTPQRGQVDLGFVVGIDASRQPVRFRFGREDPHLLVGGTTGSGKSVLLKSMLLQLAANNDPADLHFRLADPKTALPGLSRLAHVTHMVTARPGRSFHHDALAMIEDTVEEMGHRFSRLNHEAHEEDLDTARGKGKLLDVPYVVVVLEEVSVLFQHQDKGLEKAILHAVQQLGNLGRGAGIYVVLTTQYPSNKSVPNWIRQQFARIGFQTEDVVGSRVVIGRNGLETLDTPGSGIMKFERDFVRFRALFLRPDSDPPDQDYILSHLPLRPDPAKASPWAGVPRF